MESNLTFGEFEELINRWILETLDMNDNFLKQAEEIRQMFITVKNNLEKVHDVNYKVNVMKTINEILEDNLKLIDDTYNTIETIVHQLEDKVDINFKRIQLDPARMSMYTNAESINFILNEMRMKYTEVNAKIQMFDRNLSTNNAVEHFAKIMMSQLYLLEGIECSYYQLMSVLRENECKYHRFLCAKNIKKC